MDFKEKLNERKAQEESRYTYLITYAWFAPDSRTFSFMDGLSELSQKLDRDLAQEFLPELPLTDQAPEARFWFTFEGYQEYEEPLDRLKKLAEKSRWGMFKALSPRELHRDPIAIHRHYVISRMAAAERRTEK